MCIRDRVGSQHSGLQKSRDHINMQQSGQGVDTILDLVRAKKKARFLDAMSHSTQPTAQIWPHGCAIPRSEIISMLGQASLGPVLDSGEQESFGSLPRCWDCATIFDSQKKLRKHVSSGCRDRSEGLFVPH
eukprot:TRINITY_DN5523_c0_g1_i2.p1 TRINITY_DN5523_c0_g1~~TRINITY_DN5523_c0_g1_i2.p1  ORF type:complete len:131 (+),score=9.42 TRINITY_DN5523_c0_g1_i2:115-507(+)